MLGQLMYEDDCLLIAQASTEEARVVGNVLKEYGCLSGQKVNMAKSHIIYNNGVLSRIRRRIKRFLHMNKTHCPLKYLGVNIGIGMRRLPRVAFKPLLERLRAKLVGEREYYQGS